MTRRGTGTWDEMANVPRKDSRETEVWDEERGVAIPMEPENNRIGQVFSTGSGAGYRMDPGRVTPDGTWDRKCGLLLSGLVALPWQLRHQL